MNLFDQLIENACLKVIDKFKLEQRNIYRRDDDLYLLRNYIYRKTRPWLPSIYLHCFHSSDEDLELHSHPWKFSLSFILAGSYLEERLLKDGSIIHKIYRKGNFNFIRGTDFHRVDLLSDRVWTLFISGPKVSSWGFLDRNTKEYWDESEHDLRKGNRKKNNNEAKM